MWSLCFVKLLPIDTNLCKYGVPHSVMQKETAFRFVKHVWDYLCMYACMYLCCFLMYNILVLWALLECLVCLRDSQSFVWAWPHIGKAFWLHVQVQYQSLHVEGTHTYIEHKNKKDQDSQSHGLSFCVLNVVHNNRMKDDIYSIPNLNSWRAHTNLYKHTHKQTWLSRNSFFLVTCPIKVLISTTFKSFTISKTKCHLILEMTYSFPLIGWWKMGTLCPLKVKYWNLKPLQCSLEEKKHLDSMKADSLSYASLGTLIEIRFQIQIFDTWKLSRVWKISAL